MRNMETLARTLAYLVIGLLTLMAIIFVVLARELMWVPFIFGKITNQNRH